MPLLLSTLTYLLVFVFLLVLVATLVVAALVVVAVTAALALAVSLAPVALVTLAAVLQRLHVVAEVVLATRAAVDGLVARVRVEALLGVAPAAVPVQTGSLLE